MNQRVIARRTLSPALLCVAATVGGLLGACVGEPPLDAPEPARLEVFVTVDPEMSNPADPDPGLIVWFSTRAGTARFLDGDRELTDTRQPVDGGEVMTTEISPQRLEPGINDVEVYLILQNQGSTTLSGTAQLFVDAECTWHDHCVGGACEQFRCVER